MLTLHFNFDKYNCQYFNKIRHNGVIDNQQNLEKYRLSI